MQTESKDQKSADKPTPSVADAQARIQKLIKEIEVCMLTSMSAQGVHKSRPMMSQQIDSEGSIWFFTGKSTQVAEDLEENAQVNLSFAKPDKNEFVSLAGRAELIGDRAKMKELWKPIMKAWFPEGLEDPDLTLLKFTPSEGEYWDAPTGKMIQFLKIVGAALSGQGYTSSKGEHANVRM